MRKSYPQLERYHRLKDEINARKRAYRAGHREEVNLKAKLYRATRKEEIRRYNNAYSKKRYSGIKNIPTSSLISELESRRPCTRCTHGPDNLDCMAICVWGITIEDSFEEATHE